MKDDSELAAHAHWDELPDGRGWRVTFTDLDKLRPQLAGWPLDPMAPDYLAQVSQLTSEAPELPTSPFVYATDLGLELLNGAGMHWVRDSLMKPGGPELERAIVTGRACSVRRIPVQPPVHGRRLQSAPDYLQNFGLNTVVTNQLLKIADHFRTFLLSPPVVEYIAGHNFVVTEYRQGIQLDRLRLDSRAGGSQLDEPFQGQTRRWWQHWFEQFELELDYIKEIFFLLGYEKGEPFASADLSMQHFAYNGFDSKTSKPRISLMDQMANAAAPKISGIDSSDTARTSRYHELSQRYIDDGLLIRLRG